MNVTLKHSYTVPCSSLFLAAVEALAVERQVNVGDLARSVLLIVPPEAVESFPDPGEPPSHDRETVILKSGPAQGRPWRRKPRLQVRMPPGHAIPFIRRALGLALALADRRLAVTLMDPNQAVAPPKPESERSPIKPAVPPAEPIDTGQDEIERLRTIISALAFDPFPDGIRSRGEALHVLGFAPNARPDGRTIKAKFRLLATIHHPDNDLGSHQRMSQLNQAMEILKSAN